MSEKLKIDGIGTPSMEVERLKYPNRAGGFSVSLHGTGFEVYRYLNADELREIRDWINGEIGNG